MESENAEVAALQRKLSIAEVIKQGYQKVPDSVSTTFGSGQMKKCGINDVNDLKRSLNRIKIELAPDFKYDVLDYPKDSKFLVIVNMENWKVLDKYMTEIDRELQQARKPTAQHKFFLNEDGHLYLEGSTLKPYEMKKGSLRYELVCRLAKAKRHIPTIDLSEEFDATTKRIRTTIDQIRSMVSEKLKVPKESFIENIADSGYRLTNVRPKD